MNDITVFDFGVHPVRVIDQNGAPWFIAVDVCKVLDLGNPSMSLHILDDDERAKFNLGRQGDANIISESGLYALILRSRKPEARKFRKWVTAEVLPTLRKQGQYIMSSVSPEPVEPMITVSEVIEMAPCLALVREMRQVHGRAEAKRLWAVLPLPQPVFNSGALLEESRDEWFGAFLGACVDRQPGGRVQGSALYRSYIGWCREQQITPLSQNAFGRAASRGGLRKRTQGVVWYEDISLKGG